MHLPFTRQFIEIRRFMHDLRTLRTSMSVLGCALLASEPLPSYAQEEHAPKTRSENVRRQLIDETNAGRKGKWARELLEGKSPAFVQELCFDDNVGVSLLAAWKRLEIQ